MDRLLESVKSEFDYPFQDEPDLIDFNNIRQEIVKDHVPRFIYVVKEENSSASGDFFPEYLKVPVKIETNENTKEVEKTPVVVNTEWKIKNEEIDLNEEDLKQNQIIMPVCDINQHHIENEKYKCGICQFQSKWKGSLNKNNFQHENNKDIYKFTCNYCNYHQNPQKCNLKIHLLQHKNTEKDDYPDVCKCEYQTIEKNSLKLHNLQQHNNSKEGVTSHKFRCDQCEYETSTKCNLKRHIFGRHKNIEEVDASNKFKCGQCEYQTLSRSHLKIHILGRHKNLEQIDASDKFKCGQCEYETIRRSDLKRHILRHKNTEVTVADKFKCDQCEYQTIVSNDLKRHILRRHKNIEDIDASDKFKCGQCEYQTILRSDLKRHILRHHKNSDDVNASYKFKCSQCEYQTLTRRYLKRHIVLQHKV